MSCAITDMCVIIVTHSYSDCLCVFLVSMYFRIQIRDKQCKNGIDCVKKIWGQKGIKGFYRGFFPTMMRDVLEQSLALNFYNMMRKRVILSKKKERMRRQMQNTHIIGDDAEILSSSSSSTPSARQGKKFKSKTKCEQKEEASSSSKSDEKLGTPVHLGLGMLSGGISAFITAPLDVVKTRLQCGSTSKNTIGQVLMEVRTENGIRSLFAGTKPRIMQQALLFSAYFCLYEWFKLVLKSEDVREESDKDVIHKIFYKKRTKILKSLNVPVV